MSLKISSTRLQKGATLIVSLIMLVLITLLVTTSFTMSNSGLKVVGNMQSRDEGIAAANKAIEQVLSSPFTDSPAAEAINVDIDNNDSVDYEVQFSAPTCVSAERIAMPSTQPFGLAFGSGGPPPASTFYQTVWDLDAVVTDGRTGTSVRVRQGVRVLLSETEYETVCS